MPKTDAAISKGIELGWHPGAQICVWHDGKAVVNAGSGISSGGSSMRPESINLWLSSGKPVGAVAIQLLKQDRLVDLDQPVAKYWPEFGANGKGMITTRHLLTHTAGIRTAEIAALESTIQDVNSVLENARIEPGWVPGEDAGYHAFSGWQALGELVRRISGFPFDDFAKTRIFEPLGMKSCAFRLTTEQIAALGDLLSPMHSTRNGSAREDPAYSAESTSQFVRPGGGLRGTASDLVRFYRMLLAFGQLDGHQLLEPALVAEIISPQRSGKKDRTFGHLMDWGLGVMLDNKIHGSAAPYGYGPHASARAFGHGGRESSVAFADPEYDLAVAVVFNGMPGELIHDRRLRMVTAAIYRDLGLV